MTEEELAAIEARAKAATPGPWVAEVLEKKGRVPTRLVTVSIDGIERQAPARVESATQFRAAVGLSHWTRLTDSDGIPVSPDTFREIPDGLELFTVPPSPDTRPSPFRTWPVAR